jgi:hypothetical protein
MLYDAAPLIAVQESEIPVQLSVTVGADGVVGVEK